MTGSMLILEMEKILFLSQQVEIELKLAVAINVGWICNKETSK